MTREAIVQEALSWLKTPYKPMGRIKGVGTDCGQILVEVYGNCGFIEKFETGYYPIDFNQHRDTENYFAFVEQYAHKVEKPQDGDIVLYRFGRCISHSGIIVDAKNKQIVHAKLAVGVTLAQWDEGDLNGRAVGYWSVF